MRHLKGELALAATPSPAIPQISTRAVDKYLRENLENALVAEAARMELSRMYWEQDGGRLPDDGGPAWPPTRASSILFGTGIEWQGGARHSKLLKRCR